MLTLYGIPNCDTVRKARRWLEQQNLEYRFHDVRSDGLDARQLGSWADELGWEALLNRRSTTWKQLDPALREHVDRKAALALLLQHPTLMKRPLLDTGHERAVGFSAEQYRALLARHTL